MGPTDSVVSRCFSDELPMRVEVHDGSHTAAPRIVVCGELDHDSARPLERAVVRILREQRPALLELDLADVPFIDAGGIWTLLNCRSDAQQLECRLVLTRLQPEVYRVLEIVKLVDHFEVPRR